MNNEHECEKFINEIYDVQNQYRNQDMIEFKNYIKDSFVKNGDTYFFVFYIFDWKVSELFTQCKTFEGGWSKIYDLYSRDAFSKYVVENNNRINKNKLQCEKDGVEYEASSYDELIEDTDEAFEDWHDGSCEEVYGHHITYFLDESDKDFVMKYLGELGIENIMENEKLKSVLMEIN